MAQDPTPTEGALRRNRRTGEVQVYRGGQWVTQTPPSQSAPQGYTLRPMQTQADRRAEASAGRADAREERAMRAEERQIGNQERDAVRSDRQAETGMRNDFRQEPEFKRWSEVDNSWGLIRSAADLDSAQGDLQLIFAYMKMLDPTSVVREAEFDNAQRAGGLLDMAQTLIPRLASGERLSESQRQGFLQSAATVHSQAQQGFNAKADWYREMAQEYGFDPDRIARPVEIAIGSSPAAPFILEGKSDDEILAALSEGGWAVAPGGEPYYLEPGAVRRATQDDNFRDGDVPLGDRAYLRPIADAATEERRSTDPFARRVGAMTRGALDAITIGAADEIRAGLGAILPGERSVWNGRDIRQAYDENLTRERAIDRADEQDLGGWRTTGQVLGSAATPGAGMAGKFVARAPSMAGAAARSAGVGAAYGGAYGFNSAEGGVGERLENVGPGAAGGAIVGAPLGLMSRPAGGMVQNMRQRMMTGPRAQMVQTLQDNGVFLTPGQRMGGVVGTAENLAMRAPILGTAVRGARERGMGSLNRAVGNRALDAVGDGVPPNIEPGGDMVAAVGDRLGQEFERGYAMVQRFVPDDGLSQGFARIGQEAADLPPAIQQQFAKIVSDRQGRLQGEVSGAQVGQIRTGLNQLAASYRQAPDPDQQALGRLLTEVIDELDSAVARTNPEAGQILGRARDGYTDYIRMESASTKAGGRPFSPGQLETAVRQSDGSVRRGAMGRGEARMQDLSRAAREIMPDQFGNPGTADSVGLGALGIGAVTEPVTTMAAAAGLTAAATPYFMMGRKVVERLPSQASRQQLQQALGDLEQLSQSDSNVIVLRDEVARRLARAVPGAAMQGAAGADRLMTGRANQAR